MKLFYLNAIHYGEITSRKLSCIKLMMNYLKSLGNRNLAAASKEKSSRFRPEQQALLDPKKIPKHIAIIPDGNRRWAKKRFFNILDGHREGADTLMEIVKSAKELGVKEVTFYSFSTENWNRPQDEVVALMTLFEQYISNQCEEMIQSGIRLDTIGDLSSLPQFLNTTIQNTKEKTKTCQDITLILALNYGSRDELCRALKKIVKDCDQHKLKKEEISEETISHYLDTTPWGDPDLLIRTSGELRVSNFLLWQISYSEIHVAPVLWPDFTPQHLLEAIIDFQGRQRRWGGSST